MKLHGEYRLKIIHFPISSLNNTQLLDIIEHSVKSKKKITILSGNVHSFNLSYENKWLKDFFNQADFVRIDGFGIQLGAKFFGLKVPPRYTWADYAWQLASFCEDKGITLSFLGGRPGIAKNAANILSKNYPKLKISFVRNGYFDKTKGSQENEKIIYQINEIKPDILIVGFGMPLQERWLKENRNRLLVNVVFTGGAVFDYISGALRRPPPLFRKFGLEWLGRLLIEPKRLSKRYIIGNILFFYRIIRHKLGNF